MVLRGYKQTTEISCACVSHLQSAVVGFYITSQHEQSYIAFSIQSKAAELPLLRGVKLVILVKSTSSGRGRSYIDLVFPLFVRNGRLLDIRR